MRLNYNPLGNYIQEINVRNTDLAITNLLGVSMEKTFISSVANLNGVDLSVYKVLAKDQLACKLMSVGRDEKLPVDLYRDEEPAIVSSAYYVFEPKDKNELLPEYLMMWLCRPENDRYIGFISGGDVRGGISWDTFCSLPIRVPHISKQRAIVEEYNTIQNRIQLNEQLIQKLEETAQAIYREWFVEFEFPDENGKPYKSNGGEMVWNEELEKEIPKGWEVGKLDDLKLDISDGNYSSKYPKSTDFISEGIPFIRGTDFDNKVVSSRNLYFISEKQHSTLKKGHTKKGDILLSTRGEIGKMAYITNEFIDCNINAQLVRINGGTKYSTFYLGCLFESTEYKEELLSSTTGSALQQLPRKNLSATRLLIPHTSIIQEFTRRYDSIHTNYILKNNENQKLTELKDLLLSKLATVV